MEWLQANWQYVLVGFYAVEKIVKASPSKYDDILLDVVWGSVKKVVGKK
jgi:hypothetical protein|tara:strand:+ start:216 stop:362 length:147 start_codon:yes stop_codon:yes gene_type:complete